MTKDDGDHELGGLTALLKANAGMVLKECADTAVLLFGGNGYTRSGQGEVIESEYYSSTFTQSNWTALRCIGAVCADRACSDMARSTWREDPGRVRGRSNGPFRASIGQALQGKDQSSRGGEVVNLGRQLSPETKVYKWKWNPRTLTLTLTQLHNL